MKYINIILLISKLITNQFIADVFYFDDYAEPHNS